jgi:hypothetical protein
MSNSPLINQVISDPNYSSRIISGREYKITKITIHHAASRAGASAAEVANVLRKKDGGSANYCIGNDGEIVLCVPEEYRAWTSNNRVNDAMAVTIEVANEKREPNWEVSEVAFNRLIDLCVDICRRNGMDGLIWTGDSKGTLTTHDMFYATLCPGPFLKSRMGQIATEVTRRVRELNGNPSSDIEKPPVPQPEPEPEPHSSTNETANGYSPAKFKDDGYGRGKQFTVTARSGLNMRRNAGKQYDIITTLPKNTKVTWYGYYNKDVTGIKWLLVKAGKNTGYCMSSFLK